MLRPIHNIIIDGHATAIVLGDPCRECIGGGAEIEHLSDQGCIPVKGRIRERIAQCRRKPVKTIELPSEPGQPDLRRTSLRRDPRNTQYES